MSGLTACWYGAPEGMAKWQEEKSRKLQITTRSFRYVFGKLLTKLPPNICIGNPRKKKHLIRNWVEKNIPRFEKWEGFDGLSMPEESDVDGSA